MTWWYVENLAHFPATISVIVALFALWFVLWNWKYEIAWYAWSYERAFAHGERWRALTAAVTHANVLHVVFNCVSLFYLGGMEYQLGPLTYLKDSFLLLTGEHALLALMEHVLITRFRREHMRHTLTVGYSGVVFGWAAINSLIGDFGGFSFFGAFEVPKLLGPWVSLVITQLLIPNASLTGHLSGIAIGYVIGVLHWQDWYFFDDKLYAYCLTWAALYFVYNLKATVPDCRFVAWIRADSEQDLELGQIAVVNGVVARPQQRARPADDDVV